MVEAAQTDEGDVRSLAERLHGWEGVGDDGEVAALRQQPGELEGGGARVDADGGAGLDEPQCQTGDGALLVRAYV